MQRVTWVRVQVALAAGWSPAAAMMRDGLGNGGGTTAVEAMQRLIDGSTPFPSVLPSAAQIRFSKDSNSLQLRLGQKAGSGVFYVWHPADEGPAQSRLAASHAPAFVDIICTQGALRGRLKGLLFSSNKVRDCLLLPSHTSRGCSCRRRCRAAAEPKPVPRPRRTQLNPSVGARARWRSC